MWYIPKLGGLNTRQNDKLDRFFDQQEKAVSLVRESIQNSLDVAVDEKKPVRISYNFSEIGESKLANYFEGPEGSLNEHLGTCGTIINKKKIRVLVIEDFNTQGLTGETDNRKTSDDDQIISSNFLGFWWSEGLSEKKHGSGGSHGVGKVKLSTSSEYKCFWALTKRIDDGQEFLLGYSQLKFHIYKSQQYFGYARYGKLISEGQLMPYCKKEDEQFIQYFRTDFSLKRGEETGLSVIIPAVLKEINEKSVTQAVLSDFSIAILKGDLVVDVSGETGKISINAETISELTSQHLSSDEQKILVGARKMLSLHHNGFFVTKKKKPESLTITTEDFSETDLQLMQRDFESGKMVCARIPVLLQPKGGNEEKITSVFDVFVQNSESIKLSKPYQGCIRDKLLIRKERSKLTKPYSMVFVYVTDTELSEFLKYAEDPGHEKWTLTTLKDTGRYMTDAPLRLIKRSIRDFYNVLSGIEDDKTVRNVSPEIFSIKEPNTGPKRGKKTPLPHPIPKRSQSPFLVVEIADGFRIKNSKFLNDLIETDEVSLPMKCQVLTAYKIPIGNSIKRYSEFDYALENEEQFSITTDNIQALEFDGNQILFEVTKNNFTLEITGFDSNRDIEVQCQLL